MASQKHFYSGEKCFEKKKKAVTLYKKFGLKNTATRFLDRCQLIYNVAHDMLNILKLRIEFFL